jgi:nucleotidyltransferase substrate binding protein (TIGR01987 family)
MNLNKDIIRSIQSIAKKYSEIEKIVLFGSRARGDNSEKSDIDLAIFAKNNCFNDFLKFYNDVDEINTLIKFDIVNVNENIEKKLLDNIKNDGVVIMSSENKITNYIQATNRLMEAILECGDTPTSLNRDGVIQRFEFSTELAWKACKEYLLNMGYSDVNGPKEVMREAYSNGLITDGDAWIDILNDRNLTSHIYKEDIAIEIYKRIKNSHLVHFEKLSKKFCDME